MLKVNDMVDERQLRYVYEISYADKKQFYRRNNLKALLD